MHGLIDFTAFPTMPGLFRSKGPGEAWLWGDCFAILQTFPDTIAKSMQRLLNIPDSQLPPMTYPFAMTVYYKKAKNPHGPSNRPILSVTLEQSDIAKSAALYGLDVAAMRDMGLLDGGEAPIYSGLFMAGSRVNLGLFSEAVTVDNARRHFFAIIRDRLRLPGEPVHIGPIASVYGHPETGWEALSPKPKGLGCLIFAGALGTGLAGAGGLMSRWI